MNDETELTPEERATIASLPRDAVPPAELERRTVAALRALDLVRPSGRRPFRRLLVAAAAVLLFLSGLAVGRRSMAPPPSRSSDSGTVVGADHDGPPARVIVWF